MSDIKISGLLSVGTLGKGTDTSIGNAYDDVVVDRRVDLCVSTILARVNLNMTTGANVGNSYDRFVVG